MLEKYWPFQSFYKTKLKILNEEKEQIKYLTYNYKDTSDEDHVTTYNRLNILNFPLLKNLKKQITDILDQKELVLSLSWSQLYLKNHKHKPHTHLGSFYSGVIYVDGNGSDGTCFVDSLGNIYQEKFEKNVLILFPSQILHYVEPQNEDNGRLIISFNSVKK